MHNKVWEIVEKEARKGSDMDERSYRGGYNSKSSMRGYKRGSSMARKEDVESVEEAYECGYDDGYSDAMKKIFHIIRESED